MKKIPLFLLVLGVSGMVISACSAQSGILRERLEARRADSSSNLTLRDRLADRFAGKETAESEGSGGFLSSRNENASSVVIDNSEKIVFDYQGVERVFYVYRPDTLSDNQAAPALLILHGGKGTGPSMAAMVDLYEDANKHGFIAVYPQSNNAEWNDGRDATDTGVSDVDYMQEVARQLVTNWGADENRIYVAGISSGGNMSQKLACVAPSSFAGFGVLASNLPGYLQDQCDNPATLKPMVFFYGTADPLMTFDGSDSESPLAPHAKGFGEEEMLSSPKTMAYWAKKKGCLSASSVVLPDIADDGTRVVRVDFVGCSTPESAYVIVNGGHNWPGGDLGFMAEKLVGKSTQDISATEELIKFFDLDR